MAALTIIIWSCFFLFLQIVIISRIALETVKSWSAYKITTHKTTKDITAPLALCRGSAKGKTLWGVRLRSLKCKSNGSRHGYNIHKKTLPRNFYFQFEKNYHLSIIMGVVILAPSYKVLQIFQTFQSQLFPQLFLRLFFFF